MILFGALITRREVPWALYPDAPRGYLAGEQDPSGAPGDGLLTVNTVPGGREIEVRHRLSRVVVATTFSASDGTWRVSDLPSQDEYDVIARDHTGTYEDILVSRNTPYV